MQRYMARYPRLTGYVMGQLAVFAFVAVVLAVRPISAPVVTHAGTDGQLTARVLDVPGRGPLNGYFVELTYDPYALGNTALVYRRAANGAELLLALGVVDSDPVVLVVPNLTSGPNDSRFFFYPGDTYYVVERFPDGATLTTDAIAPSIPPTPTPTPRTLYAPVILRESTP